jgi:4-carboxymuconolactone decarboxylase
VAEVSGPLIQTVRSSFTIIANGGLTRDQMTEEQGAELDQLAQSRPVRDDGTFGGSFDLWIRSPEFSRRVRGLATMLWERTTLDRGIVELAISITAQLWRSNIEWVAHAPRAVQYGIPQEVLDTVFTGERPDDAADEQVVLFDVCVGLHEERELPQALYRQAVETFGDQGLVEITGVVGFYTLVVMTLTSFAVEPDADVDVPYSRRT